MILVTGATGTFGSEVAEALIGRGNPIRVASTSADKLQKRFGKRAEPSVFDWNDTPSFEEVLSGIETVYLIAPPFSSDFDVKTKAFLEVAKKQNVKNIIVTTAYGADAAVGSSMYNTEEEVKNSGFNYTVLRPNFIFQNFDKYDLETIKSNIIFLPTGDGATSYLDIRDVAEVSAEILTNPSAYNKQELVITGDEAITHQSMATTFTEVLGRSISNINPSEEEYKSTLKEAGVPEVVYDFMAMLYAAIKANHMGNITSVVKDVTGKNPRKFETYVKENIELFKN
ncbi:MAG: SDR family oxidoreductase [Cyclobacteriaceae bacterium]